MHIYGRYIFLSEMYLDFLKHAVSDASQITGYFRIVSLQGDKLHLNCLPNIVRLN